MRKINVGIFLIGVSLLSCTRNVYVYKKVPPGQAKKASGHKSAKPYAPGQVKKKNSW